MNQEALTVRDRELLKLRRNNPCYTLQQIANEFGVSRERVRQILSLHQKRTRHLKTTKYCCLRCGVEITKNRKYCSQKCFFEDHNILVTCDHCGKQFYRMVSAVLSYPNRPMNPRNFIFCDKSCFGKYFGRRNKKS